MTETIVTTASIRIFVKPVPKAKAEIDPEQAVLLDDPLSELGPGFAAYFNGEGSMGYDSDEW